MFWCCNLEWAYIETLMKMNAYLTSVEWQETEQDQRIWRKICFTDWEFEVDKRTSNCSVSIKSCRLLTLCSQIPLPSPGCGGRSPGVPGTVPAGCATPCSPLAQELPQPLPEQPAVHPSQPPGASWPSRSHGCCGHPHQSGPEDLWPHLKVRVHLVQH